MSIAEQKIEKQMCKMAKLMVLVETMPLDNEESFLWDDQSFFRWQFCCCLSSEKGFLCPRLGYLGSIWLWGWNIDSLVGQMGWSKVYENNQRFSKYMKNDFNNLKSICEIYFINFFILTWINEWTFITLRNVYYFYGICESNKKREL